MTSQDAGTDTQVGLIAAVWRYRWLTLGLAVIGGLLAVGLSLSASASTQAKATVALTDPRGNSVFRQGSSANLDLNRYTAERAAFAESEQVLGAAAKSLGGDATVESVNSQVEATPDPDKSIISIVAETPTAAQSKKVADAVANAYQDLSADETKEKAALALSGLESQRQDALTVIRNPVSTPAEISAGTQTLSAVNARAAEIQSSAELFGNGVSFYDPARPVKTSGLTGLIRNGAAGALIGLVIGAAIAWALADRRQRRSPDGPASTDAGGGNLSEAEHLDDAEPVDQLAVDASGDPAWVPERHENGGRSRTPRLPETLP